jgi:hypothetical protein
MVILVRILRLVLPGDAYDRLDGGANTREKENDRKPWLRVKALVDI